MDATNYFASAKSIKVFDSRIFNCLNNDIYGESVGIGGLSDRKTP
jgi:hypothetical protein